MSNRTSMSSKSLDAIIEACKDYIGNLDYVYKLVVYYSTRYIVVMKKLPETLKNEHRIDVVDAHHAKFRASVLEVVLIIDIADTNERPVSIVNRYVGCRKTLYTVGEKVVPEIFDLRANVVCSGGIHYFKTVETAFSYGHMPLDFTGCWTTWHTCGRKHIESEYVNGQRMGQQKEWYDNGQIKYEGVCTNGKKNGKWTKWYVNGQTRSENEYVDGEYLGKQTEWYKNGQVEREKCFNGKSLGHFNKWHANGHKYMEGGHIDGKLEGHWIEWYKDGQKRLEGDYTIGEILGKYDIWYESGQQCVKIDFVDENDKKYEGDIDRSQLRHCTTWHKNGQKAFEGYFVSCEDDKFAINWTAIDEDAFERLYEEVEAVINVCGKKIDMWLNWNSKGESI